MATAKKLPSGNWRTLEYSHTEPGTNKRKYVSFTATTKWESEYMAAEYRAKKKQQRSDMTVLQAMERYIASKEKTLSPSTIREYKGMIKRSLLSIHNISLQRLSQEDIQKAISEEASKKSSKSVRNIHGLLSATLSMFTPDFKLNTSLPQKTKAKFYVPTEDEIKKLLATIIDTDIEIPVLLAATGSLRRSEIAALTTEDITDSGININKAMVQNADNQWVIKIPKTTAGYRFTPLSKEVIEKLRKCPPGRITNLNPGQIYKKFKQALVNAELPDFRLHDLRHYYASILHFLKVPDKYIMKYGGWSSDKTLKNVYQHVMSDKDKLEQEKVTAHFSSVTNGKNT